MITSRSCSIGLFGSIQFLRHRIIRIAGQLFSPFCGSSTAVNGQVGYIVFLGGRMPMLGAGSAFDDIAFFHDHGLFAAFLATAVVDGDFLQGFDVRVRRVLRRTQVPRAGLPTSIS